MNAPGDCEHFEITVLAKAGGPLTKRIALAPDGTLRSDGSACIMSAGVARRATFSDLAAFAACIGGLASYEAIALGALRDDLPERVDIATKIQLQKLNGGGRADLIARTATNIHYRAAAPALALIDFDTKSMPPAVATRIDADGGLWNAMVRIVPDLASVGHVIRASTSAGLYRMDTDERLPGSQNQHIYLQVSDGTDIDRFLRTLHDRCWLAGYGWMMVGAGGQLLERSVVDRMVGAPERLVFEGPPITEAPVAQDRAARVPTVIEGDALDTIAACPPLSVVEQARLCQLRAQEAQRLAPDARRARKAFVAEHTERLAQRIGIAADRAERIIASQSAGVLLPHVLLPFDDPELAGTTVGDVLADPTRYEGCTLADPVEGIAYGVCKARVMRRADGTPWIHSFAHGRTVYELKLDAEAANAAVEKAPKEEVAAAFVHAVLAGALNDAEVETLRNRAAKRAEIGVRALNRMLKDAQASQRQQLAQEEQDRRAADRTDPRQQLPVPKPDAPWLPTMSALNEVLGSSTVSEPPMRDIDGVVAAVRVRRFPGMHLLTATGANAEEPDESRLPPPEHPLLTRLTEPQLAELIERHIDYVDGGGRSVHLPASFVKHYQTRTDDALPLVAAIATLPMVLPNATILSGQGLNRERGIVFRVPPALEALLPTAQECTPAATAEALRFLMDDWLTDVAADAVGKCILIAAALTPIERSLLPDRPVFFVTAGRRGGGKTTTLIMLMMAITGMRPAAATWSPNEEERRKALLAYLLEGSPAIIWDNLARGTQISCPHIERACTTQFYIDRRLGVSELAAAAVATIQLFTGNNVGPKGDLASRSLAVRLEVDRADPENREFHHPDPIGWTEANRGRILRALYTILLGNPLLQPGCRPTNVKTRFKTWWRLVGAAIEHAASLRNIAIDFQHLFLAQEEDDEESASLIDALVALADKWPSESKFLAADIARMVNDRGGDFVSDDERQRSETLREFLFPNLQHNHIVTAKAVGKRLHRHIDEPVKHGHDTLVLRSGRDDREGPHGSIRYFVRQSRAT